MSENPESFIPDDIGDTESSGTMFYRCMTCATPLGPWDIDEGGCPKCAGVRVRPTNLSFFEKLSQIIRRPFIWDWPR